MADVTYLKLPQPSVLDSLAEGLHAGVNKHFEREEAERKYLANALPTLISAGMVQPTRTAMPDIEVGGVGFNYSSPRPDMKKSLETMKLLQQVSGSDSGLIADLWEAGNKQWESEGIDKEKWIRKFHGDEAKAKQGYLNVFVDGGLYKIRQEMTPFAQGGAQSSTGYTPYDPTQALSALGQAQQAQPSVGNAGVLPLPGKRGAGSINRPLAKSRP